MRPVVSFERLTTPVCVKVPPVLTRRRLAAKLVSAALISIALMVVLNVDGLPFRKVGFCSALAPVSAPASERTMPPWKLNWLVPLPICATPSVLLRMSVPSLCVVMPVYVFGLPPPKVKVASGAMAMFHCVTLDVPVPLAMTPFHTVFPVPRILIVRVEFSVVVNGPLMVRSAPPSRLLLMVWSFAPACLVTVPLMVIALAPPKTAVELLPRMRLTDVARGAPTAKMPPLVIVRLAAEPMPFAVRPSMPPLAFRAPVKVFAEAGFKIHTPPSAFVTVSTLVPPFVSVEVMALPSVLLPRRLSV